MDQNTKQLDLVVRRITQRLSDTLREWAQEASGSPDIGLEALEKKVQRGLHALGGEILQELVDLVGTGKTEAPVLCPECSDPMDFVRYQAKWVETLFGPIRPERAYFHCPGCHEGHVPLDHRRFLQGCPNLCPLRLPRSRPPGPGTSGGSGCPG